jgi:hypothetical protein
METGPVVHVRWSSDYADGLRPTTLTRLGSAEKFGAARSNGPAKLRNTRKVGDFTPRSNWLMYAE